MNIRFTCITTIVLGSLLVSGIALTGCDKQVDTPTPPKQGPVTPTAPPAAPTLPKADAATPASPHETVTMAPPKAPSTDVVPSTAPAAVHGGTPPAATPGGAKPAVPIEPPTDNKVATFAGLAGPKPATWVWHPTTKQFNLAEYAVPAVEGSDQAKISVITAGGTLEANIERWKGMFRTADQKPVEPKIERFTSDGMDIALVEFAGEYKGMGMATFEPDQLFLTGVIDAPSGQLFVRLVGPAKTVEANRQAFMELLHGIHQVDAEK